MTESERKVARPLLACARGRADAPLIHRGCRRYGSTTLIDVQASLVITREHQHGLRRVAAQHRLGYEQASPTDLGRRDETRLDTEAPVLRAWLACAAGRTR